MSSREVWLAVLGAAVAGGLCAGEIESITFAGDSFARSVIAPTTNTHVVCDFQLLEVPQGMRNMGVFGSLAVGKSDGLNYGWGLRAHGTQNGDDAKKGRWLAWCGHDYVYITNNAIDTGRHTVELRNGSVKFDDNVYTTGPARDPAAANLNLATFDIGDEGWGGGGACARMRFFSMKVYRTKGNGEEELVADFVPWEDNGMYGVYDKVTTLFHAQRGGKMPILHGAWSSRPSVTPVTWSRRAPATPTIDCGDCAPGVTVSCSHTPEQLAALPVGSHRVVFTTASADSKLNGKTYPLVVTVTDDPFVCTFSENGARVSCTFAPAAEARTLYLAYGATDGGDSMGDWDHAAALATVPANATSLTDVAVPAEVLASAPVMCAFLQESATRHNALSYVRHENLLAQWDGIENAGYGLPHDGARSYPVELCRGLTPTATEGTLPAEAKSFTMENGHLKFLSKAIADAFNEGRATVELTFGDTPAGPRHNGGIFCQGESWVGGNTRGFWVYQSVPNGVPCCIGDISYHGTDGQCSGMMQKNEGATNVYSFVLADQPKTSYLMRNGVNVKQITRNTTFSPDDSLFLGVLPGSYFGSRLRPRAKICSIRVYNIRLTDEEIAANVEVDRKRFWDPYEKSDVFYRTLPLTVTHLEKQGSTPIAADVTFSGSSEVRDLYIIWGRQDAGSVYADWTQRAKICDVPAGVTSLANVAVPEAARASLAFGGGFRFAICRRMTARSYVRPADMLAQWDGIENDGFGRAHNAARGYPAELVNNTATTTSGVLRCEAKSFSIGASYMKLSMPTLQTAINEGHCTVELVMADDGERVNNGGIFSQGNTSRGVWIFQKKLDGQYPGLFGDVTYHGNMAGDWNCFNNVKDVGTNTYSVVLGPDTASSFFAFDGVKRNKTSCQINNAPDPQNDRSATLTRFTTDVNDADLYIGILPGNWFGNGNGPKARAKICSIRVYNCTLSEAEIAENLSVDAERFRDALSTHNVLSDYILGGRERTVFIVR